MKTIKVLVVNRPRSAWQGGDYFQLEKTVEALRSLGVDVEVSETPLISPAVRMKEFDIVHTFNFSMAWSKYAIWAGKKWDKKTVSSMIYHESDQFIPYDLQQIMLDNTDACVFLSETEIERVKRHLNLKEKQTFIVPNGIDPMFFNDVGEPKEGLVLTVGRIERSKGQLSVGKVCKKLGIPFICIGETIEPEYAKELSEYATIFSSISQEELIPYYARAKVFALVSRAEVMPLSCMEAGSQGCNLVITSHSEWKPKGCEIAEFEDEESIEKAIVKAMKKKYNSSLRKRLEKMTWLAVGKKIKKIYETILHSSNS